MKPANIRHLASGGLITNYYCTCACRHCLYGCSPGWPKEYITPETAERNLRKVRELGCFTMHIGGGEPFLNFEALKQTVRIFNKLQMGIDYIETNSCWYREPAQAGAMLAELLELGVHTLLISISPFHNEFIPYRKVEGVVAACAGQGMKVFPWVSGFAREIVLLDKDIPHAIEEHGSRGSADYLLSLPGRYWITMRGRALKTYAPYRQALSPEQIFKAHPGPCPDLLDTSHFHVDLYGNYIPGLCSGLAIKTGDLTGFRENSTYPLINALLSGGIRTLWELAVSRYHYPPEAAYVSRCDICYKIRKFLLRESGEVFNELEPAAFYKFV